MIYLLGSVGVLLTVLLTAMVVMVAARGIDLDDIDPDDDDEDDEPIGYVRRVPPFPIVHLGRCGEHDRYPIPDSLRRTWIAYLEASWNLPDRESGATR